METVTSPESFKKFPTIVNLLMIQIGNYCDVYFTITLYISFEFPFSCELAFKIMTCTEEGIKNRQDELRKHMPRAPQ